MHEKAASEYGLCLVTQFNPNETLIIVEAVVTGPTASLEVRLALDSGAQTTSINKTILTLVGYDLTKATYQIPMTTVSGVEHVPVVMLQHVNALAREAANLLVLAHSLPPSANLDGLLGLDFLRDQKLTIDFRNSTITLE